MKIRGNSDSFVKKAGILHGVVTIIAYIIGIIWLAIDRIGFIDLGYLFLVIWFQAVMLGSYTTIAKLLMIKNRFQNPILRELLGSFLPLFLALLYHFLTH